MSRPEMCCAKERNRNETTVARTSNGGPFLCHDGNLFSYDIRHERNLSRELNVLERLKVNMSFIFYNRISQIEEAKLHDLTRMGPGEC